MKRAFRGGARSETLKPDPVTELPLTPPAEEDDDEAAISSPVEFSLHSAALALSPTAPPPRPTGAAELTSTRAVPCSRPRGGTGSGVRVPLAVVGVAGAERTSGSFSSSSFPDFLFAVGISLDCLEKVSWKFCVHSF